MGSPKVNPQVWESQTSWKQPESFWPNPSCQRRGNRSQREYRAMWIETRLQVFPSICSWICWLDFSSLGCPLNLTPGTSFDVTTAPLGCLRRHLTCGQTRTLRSKTSSSPHGPPSSKWTAYSQELEPGVHGVLSPSTPPASQIQSPAGPRESASET